MGEAYRAFPEQVANGSRRRSTVLFVRVSGNDKPQVEKMTPRRRCIEALVQAAELSGGRVLRKQGDLVMAVFSSPDAATAAAVRMHAYTENHAEASTNLRVRIGLHAGLVEQAGRDVLGDTVNLALDFTSKALAGQIVTSAETVSELSASIQTVARPFVAGSSSGQTSLREVAWREAASRILEAQKRASTAQHSTIRLSYRDKVLVRRRDWDVVTMGRDPSLDFVIPDQTASRQHCDVTRRDGKFVLRDYSTNGTFVMVPGEGELHVQHDELVLAKAGWIALGQSADVTEEVIRYACE